MYFAALKKAIQHLDEKRFYDVALLFLSQQGYQDIQIVDGKGDGGRDVICSRRDLRIQLSVRKDWGNKLNEEGRNSLSAHQRHFIYVTNRVISPEDQQAFRAGSFKFKGQVEITIHDLNRIATSLSEPGVIQRTYEMLGMSIGREISASPKEIAISTILLFSKESQDLRSNVVESNVRAWLLKYPNISEERVVAGVAPLIPGVHIEREVRSSISRLQASGRILGKIDSLYLSDSEASAMRAAEAEYLISTKADVDALVRKYGITEEEARDLLKIAVELIAREKPLGGDGAVEDALASAIAKHNLNKRKMELYEDLSAASIVRTKQYGRAIDHIFAANTFDIYRALGGKTSNIAVLDASVAMPVMFGLAFGGVRSRYSIAANALLKLCKDHEIAMVVPNFYVNEMAAHGLKALDFLSTYNGLPEEAKSVLRASKNAYLSHYSSIRESINSGGEQLSLTEFLEYFGISRGCDLIRVENTITTILAGFGIGVQNYRKLDPRLKQLVEEKKPFVDPRIVMHDAIACTLLREDSDHGYLFATWDKVLVELVEGLSRILADTPARIIDFLSMAASARYECEQSYELLTTLIHCDDQKAEAFAKKIEAIRTTEQLFTLKKFMDNARAKSNAAWKLEDEKPDELHIDIERADETAPRQPSPWDGRR